MKFYSISACKYSVSLTQTKKTVNNTKFTLLEGPKIYVLNFIFREISPKFEKSLRLQLDWIIWKLAYVICKVITYGYHLLQYLPSKVSHFRYFRFSCWNLDDHFEGQNFKTKEICCVCIENRAMLKFSESLNPKEPFIMKIWYPDY